jgi:sensor histidine kinase regulating citrate/malate metabolism
MNGSASPPKEVATAATGNANIRISLQQTSDDLRISVTNQPGIPEVNMSKHDELLFYAE